MTSAAAEGARPWEYSAFRLRVAAVQRPGPSWVRVTLAGPSLRHFAPWGLDQRIKLVLPLPDGSFADTGLLDEPTPHPSHWYTRWKQLPEAERNVLRTYTPSGIRPEAGELDIDVLQHEPDGPASRWARTARIGDPVVVNGPDVRAGWTGYGLHWAPRRPVSRALLIGDETAIPAIRGILASLAADAPADVLLELGDPGDDLVSAEAAGPGVRVHRTLRGDAEHGRALEALVRRWTAQQQGRPAREPGLQVWIAGETGAVARIRAHLTGEIGIPRPQVAFLGYWRLGGPLVA